MKINRKFQVVGLVLFLMGLSCSIAFAESIRDRVLGDVNVDQTDQNIVIKVSFNFPVRYLRHYPQDYGREVNIQVEPIITNPENKIGLMHRESLPAPPGNPAGLVRFQYEGNDLFKPTIRVVLNKASKYQVKQGDDFRSLVILLPLTSAGSGTGGTVDSTQRTAGMQEPVKLTKERQDSLLAEGEKMMAAKEYMRAILIYTRLLDSSDSGVRELAQFQLATAQESKGHLAHARAEYKNYLMAYPEGKNVNLARERLNALMENIQGGGGDISGVADGQWIHEYYGGLSVYYERDESLYENQKDIENYSSLITGFDATLKSRNNIFVSELVAIGSYELSFLDTNDDETRVNRLYINLENTTGTITGRLGRQSSSKGGVLTRFDGAGFGYHFTDKIRMNLVAGYPVNLPYDDLETDKYFYGVNFDLGRFADHWDVNTYFINQISDDVDDRRALGGEVRFVGQQGSLYSLLDYDILYDELSVFLLSGNYLLPNNSTRINIMADFRGVPILSSSNALIGQNSPSLEALEEAIGEDELRRLAEDRTLDSSFATVGISQPLTETLQIAGDISWTKIDGAPASGGLEAFESTGDEFYYSLQFLGSSLVRNGDFASAGLRYGDTKLRDYYTFSVNYRYPFSDIFRISPRMKIEYRENKVLAGEQWRFIPGLRIEYTLGKDWRFEIDGEYRYADQALEGIVDSKDGYSLSLGFRWDF
ncbi:MAG: hypothetical protein M8357_08035 [Desulfobulbaceae bacterium]|nr:hypothetical protein [Desulfobulbaceae bacterium]